MRELRSAPLPRPHVLPVGLLLGLLIGALGPTPAASANTGVSWVEGELDTALARARKTKQNVLVEVYAHWCDPCKKQATEVFRTKMGAALTQRLVAWRVDFDAERTRPLMERWNVLSLPTILFLRPDGTEIDRIEGYEDAQSFVKEAELLAAGKDPLPALQKRLAAAEQKGDRRARLKLLVDVAHRRLVRGEIEAGVSTLERAAIEDVDGRAGAAEHSLFLLGRYYSRVKRDYATGRHVWRELYTRFPDGEYATTAAWWYVGALHELGRDKLAVDVLISRVNDRPGDADALDLLISFVESKGAGAKAAAAALNRARGRLPATAHAELVARLRAAGKKGA